MISEFPLGGRKLSYLLPTSGEPVSFADSKFVNWFVKFDEETLRPFLIYKYSIDKVIAEHRFEDIYKSAVGGNNVDTRIEMMASFRNEKMLHSMADAMKPKDRSFTTVGNNYIAVSQLHHTNDLDQRKYSLPDFQSPGDG